MGALSDVLKLFFSEVWAGVRVVVPWCMVLLPVVVLFSSSLDSMRLAGLELDVGYTAAGAFIFLLGFVYVAWNHELNVRRKK